MSCHSHCNQIGEVLAEMEDSILNLVRWARVIQDLGSVDGGVSANGLRAIGDAMTDDAKAAVDGWKRCFDLSGDIVEGGR